MDYKQDLRDGNMQHGGCWFNQWSLGQGTICSAHLTCHQVLWQDNNSTPRTSKDHRSAALTCPSFQSPAVVHACSATCHSRGQHGFQTQSKWSKSRHQAILTAHQLQSVPCFVLGGSCWDALPSKSTASWESKLWNNLTRCASWCIVTCFTEFISSPLTSHFPHLHSHGTIDVMNSIAGTPCLPIVGMHNWALWRWRSAPTT